MDRSAGSGQSTQADYGLDAPLVIRNLFAVALVAIIGWVAAVIARSHGFSFPKPLLAAAGIAFNLAVLCVAMGIWIIWESKIGKFRVRDRMLRRIDWKGHEHVLDVGCGRGLLAIGAAKRLTTGTSTGIDIWQSEDLTGNNPEAARNNASLEGVAERVTIETADMRKLPYPNESFDVVVSRAAIHNIYNAADRTRAITEIARVLKPGGQAVIDDIRHLGNYARDFAAGGCTDTRIIRSWVSFVLLFVLTFGSLRPATIVVRK